MKKSRLRWYKQSKLIELFIAGSTARTATSIISVNKSTASYYFQCLRLLIYDNSEHLELIEGVKPMKVILVEHEKVSVDVEQAVKHPCLAFKA